MKNLLMQTCWGLFMLVVTGCKDPLPGRIQVNLVEHITHNSAIIQSEIFDVGKGVGLQFSGICAHQTKIPVPGDLMFTGTAVHESGVLFRTGVSGLEPDTRYILRAYCETNEGFFYSDTFSIRTKPVAFLTDPRDGRNYPVKTFGTAVWMIQNLDYQSPGSMGFEEGIKMPPTEFGRLYSCQEALVVCPPGWHLPADEEWKQLEEACGVPASELDKEAGRGAPAGGKMKEPGSRLWETDPAVFATNETGFTVVPSGWYNPLKKEFTSTWYGAGYWSVPDPSQHFRARLFYSSSESVSRLSLDKGSGYFSVRCVKD